MKKPVDFLFPPSKMGKTSYLRIVLRGVSQLCFQSNELAGLFFLVAVLIASPISFVYLGIAALFAPAGRMLLGERGPILLTGLPGLNPCLIALSLPAFFKTGWSDISMWITLIACIAAAVVLVRLCVAILPFPTLALPFLIIFWTLYALSSVFNFLEPIVLPTKIETTFHPVTAVLFSLGQAIFSPSIWSGLVFLTGLFLSNWRHGLIAFLGAIIGTTVSYYYRHVDPMSVDLGLYGFNGVLSAVSVFVFCGNKLRLSLFGAILATMIMPVIAKLGIQTLSSPFVFTTWLMLGLGWFEYNWFNTPPSLPPNSKSDKGTRHSRIRSEKTLCLQ
ncbi:MAG: Urea transporter [Chlamydiales bacterium]|nr:Urea transporter [Chlamydiales bacterium]